MTEYSTLSEALIALGVESELILDVFNGIVPILLGALVVVGCKFLARWIARSVV